MREKIQDQQVFAPRTLQGVTNKWRRLAWRERRVRHSLLTAVAARRFPIPGIGGLDRPAT
jgi:hypothetical protein